MTRRDGTVYYLDEDTTYTQIMTTISNGYIQGPVGIRDYMPLFIGTPVEREAIVDAILARAKRDPSFTAGAWRPINLRSSSQRTTTFYAVRCNDGKFHNLSMEQITGALINGYMSTLEVQGSVTEQRQFFAAVRRHISTIKVVQGKNIKEQGVVSFKEPEVQKALATVDDLEAMFENFVLNSMEPVTQEAELADAMDGMDMNSMQPVAEEADLAEALDNVNM